MMPNIFETGDVDLKKVLSASAEDTDLIVRIKSILGPFILRRLKSDVMQQLVPKTQKVECLEMVPEQADAYKEAIEEYRTASLARLAKASGTVVENVADILPRRQISNYFTQFRKIANHPLLVRRIYSDNDVDSLARKLHPRGAFGLECTLDRVIEELLGYNDFPCTNSLFCTVVWDQEGYYMGEMLYVLQSVGHWQNSFPHCNMRVIVL